MQRRNTQTLGEVLRDFFEDNTELYEKMMEIRVQRAWGEVLGPTIMQYTRNIYVKDMASRKKEYSRITLCELSDKIMDRLEQTELFQAASCIALCHALPGTVGEKLE